MGRLAWGGRWTGLANIDQIQTPIPYPVGLTRVLWICTSDSLAQFQVALLFVDYALVFKNFQRAAQFHPTHHM